MKIGHINNIDKIDKISEANISLIGVSSQASNMKSIKMNCDIFCFTIEWIRLVRQFP